MTYCHHASCGHLLSARLVSGAMTESFPFGPVARTHGRPVFARRLLPQVLGCVSIPCGIGAGQTNSEAWRHSLI